MSKVARGPYLLTMRGTRRKEKERKGDKERDGFFKEKNGKQNKPQTSKLNTNKNPILHFRDMPMPTSAKTMSKDNKGEVEIQVIAYHTIETQLQFKRIRTKYTKYLCFSFPSSLMQAEVKKKTYKML